MVSWDSKCPLDAHFRILPVVVGYPDTFRFCFMNTTADILLLSHSFSPTTVYSMEVAYSDSDRRLFKNYYTRHIIMLNAELSRQS